ncbi:MAG: c-type cytochrome [Terriglobia bacterium]
MYWFKTPLGLATVISIVAFLALSADTLRQMPSRTHSDEISPQVVEGKHLWQHYDCNDCHTIFGIGGYYAPDVTKAYAIRGDAWLRKFLADPHAMYPTGRQMPNFRLADAQIGSLVAYLKWVSEVDTNGWPPAPKGVARASAAPGAGVFLAQHCNTCHSIQGSGGEIGPDLTHVGSRRSADWILQQVNDPQSHKPDSVMPSFAKVPEAEKQQLVEYLAGLK